MSQEHHVTERDVTTLIGEAVYQRAGGLTDMPGYLFDLAERIALELGRPEMAEQVRHARFREVFPAPRTGEEEQT